MPKKLNIIQNVHRNVGSSEAFALLGDLKQYGISHENAINPGYAWKVIEYIVNYYNEDSKVYKFIIEKYVN